MLWPFLSVAQTSDCGCTDCPLAIPDAGSMEIVLDVRDATNNTLGQNGQGLCQVALQFSHDYLGSDLEITLTSPAGQKITLVGPGNCFACPRTANTAWNVQFVACKSTPRPDPGIPPKWDNEANWGFKVDGKYDGSYYPYQGCLEDFNTGTVNGRWRLTVSDANGDDMGELQNFKLIFCDPRGISCGGCSAEAGNLLQRDLTICANSPRLNLSLPPSYTISSGARDSSVYRYTYVISDAKGVMLAYADSPDLRTYAPGAYTICGLSYRKSQRNRLPAPNGQRTVNELNTQLNAPSNVLFCGDLTDNCVNVTIAPAAALSPRFDGNKSVCINDTSVYFLINPPGVTYFDWRVKAPAQIVRGQGTNQIYVAWNQAAEGEVCLRLGNSCDTSELYCLPVALVRPPDPPVAIGGLPYYCPGNQGVYTVIMPSKDVKYKWNISFANDIPRFTPSFDSIVVSWTGLSDAVQQICVQSNNICGDSRQACLELNKGTPANKPQITGPAEICGGSDARYQITPQNGITEYVWRTVVGTAMLSTVSTAPVLDVRWPNATASGAIMVAGRSATCGLGPFDTLQIRVNPTPTARAGADRTVCNLSDTLRATLSTAGNTGVWRMVGGPMAAVLSDVTASRTNISVLLPGAYQFEWTETNGRCSSRDTVQMRFNVPLTATPAIETCDAINENYTVSFNLTGGSGTPVIAGGSVNNGVFRSNPVASGSPYNFTIADPSGCPAPTIRGTKTCPCSSFAGTMPVAVQRACGDAPITATRPANAFLDANDQGIFVLHTNSGAALGTVLAQNTTGIFTYQPGINYGITYYISYVVASERSGLFDRQDRCLSVSPGQPVIFVAGPTAIAGPDADTCGLSLRLRGQTATIGTGQWGTATGPGTLQFSNAADPRTAVTASTPGVYDLGWTVTNDGCSSTDRVQLRFNDIPVARVQSLDCDANNERYRVRLAISGGRMPYTVNGQPPGADTTLTTPFFSNQQSYNFTITDANGCRAAPVSGRYECPCSTRAATVPTALLNICGSDSVVVRASGNAVRDGNDTLLYVLHTLSGTALGTVVAQNTSGVFRFQQGLQYGRTYYISQVVGSRRNQRLDVFDRCLSVSPGQPVVFVEPPKADAGLDRDTCGISRQLAAIRPLRGTGRWSVLSGPGSASLSDPTLPNSRVTATQQGDYTLLWTVTDRGCSASDQMVVRLRSKPTAQATPVCDADNERFRMRIEITGGLPPYAVNNQPFGGNTFNAPPLVSGQPYQFTVSDANNCTAAALTGIYNCPCASRAALATSLSPLALCSSDSTPVIALPAAATDANDAVAYVLHTAPGAVLGQVLARSANGIFRFQEGLQYGVTYYISQIVGTRRDGWPDLNDRCLSVAPGRPVVFTQTPTARAGTDDIVCGPVGRFKAVQGQFPGKWEQTAGPMAARIFDTIAPNSAVQVRDFGTYRFRWRETNGVCSASDEVELRFNALPTVSNTTATCKPDRTAYNVSLTITGGLPDYTVVGLAGTIVGNTFTSADIPGNTPYRISVADANGCFAPQTLTGSKDCKCRSSAGVMRGELLTLCAGETARAVWDGNSARLEPEETIRFVLHDRPGDQLGKVFAIADQPAFNWDAIQLRPTTVYYISAVVASRSGNGIDQPTACFAVAPGTPVTWRPLPSARIVSRDQAICLGDTARLRLRGLGLFPLDVQYRTNNGTIEQVRIRDSILVPVIARPPATTQYRLVAAQYPDAPGCRVLLTDTVRVAVNRPLQAGQALAPVTFCANDTTTLNLADQLRDESPGGRWRYIGDTPLPSGAFDSIGGVFGSAGLAGGNFRFQYRVTPKAPCPASQATVTVDIKPIPVADAGLNKTLDCQQKSIKIGGLTTTLGNGTRYTWRYAGQAIPGANAATLAVDTPGIYTLLVTDRAGCQAADSVTVAEDTELPVATSISVRPVRCYGERNGQLRIEGLKSTRLPVEYSLNDNLYVKDSIFREMPAGRYVVSIIDALGCEWRSVPIVLPQPEELTVDLGADREMALGDSARLGIAVTPPDVRIRSITWEPADSSFNMPTYIVSPLKTARYQVTVIDSNGCVAIDDILVQVTTGRSVYIPNAISPLSGGDNAALAIYANQEVSEIALFQVYDRWGALLHDVANFPPNDPTFAWKAMHRGTVVPPGVYAYKVIVKYLDRISETIYGNVTVLR